MKKIDPLYILAFSFLLVVISSISFYNSKQDIKAVQKNFIEVSSLGIKYKNLKNDWSDKKSDIALLDNIISSSGIKNIDKHIEDKKIKLEISKLSLKEQDKFVNKLLNEKLNILKLNISIDNLEIEIGI